MWHDGWHSLLWDWVPLRESFYQFWRVTHTKGLRTRSPTSPEEGRSEKRWKSSQQKGAEETIRQNRSVRRWESATEDTSQQKSEKAAARTWWPTKAGLTNAGGWVSIASGFVIVFARVHARISSQNAQKVLQTLLSCTWS